MSWNTYYEAVKCREPSKLLRKALGYCHERGAALDLGAGMLQDSRALLEAGFGRVVAVDRSPVSEAAAKMISAPGFHFLRCDFEEFPAANVAYDLVLARDSLFFCTEEGLVALLGRIRRSVKAGGVFAADFLGSRDDWIGRHDITCLSVERIRSLLKDWQTIQFFETEFDGATADGVKKHWHYVKFIGRPDDVSAEGVCSR